MKLSGLSDSWDEWPSRLWVEHSLEDILYDQSLHQVKLFCTEQSHWKALLLCPTVEGEVQSQNYFDF